MGWRGRGVGVADMELRFHPQKHKWYGPNMFKLQIGGHVQLS